MAADAALELRRDEFARRVEALPTEVASWRKRSVQELDLNAHFSQLEALDTLIGVLVERQRDAMAMLNAADPIGFIPASARLTGDIIKGQRVWDYFRDKLELRFNPDFRDGLWVADAIAWDCYRPVMTRAVAAGIVDAAHVREPPLTYLTAEFSPATWVRGSRPNDGREYSLGEATSPIPVIEIPWDHMSNLWELVSLQHEVGHDLEADLRLRNPLVQALQTCLSAGGVPHNRIDRWKSWQGELFADLIGLHLGGPAFALGLMHLLMRPNAEVVKYDPEDPHPTHYPRILLNALYLRSFTGGQPDLSVDASAIEATWHRLYGQQPQFDPFMADAPLVFQALMSTPLLALQQRTVASLMPYRPLDEANIRAAASYLRTGQNALGIGTVPPRHWASAARLAVADAAGQPIDEDARRACLEQINKRMAASVRSNVPAGLRGGESSKSHSAFVASFADRIDLNATA